VELLFVAVAVVVLVWPGLGLVCLALITRRLSDVRSGLQVTRVRVGVGVG
jgi:hypothetical protein